VAAIVGRDAELASLRKFVERDVSVIIAPVGLAFRGELDAPSPYCGF
jgi:hypothetical protein